MHVYRSLGPAQLLLRRVALDCSIGQLDVGWFGWAVFEENIGQNAIFSGCINAISEKYNQKPIYRYFSDEGSDHNKLWGLFGNFPKW